MTDGDGQEIQNVKQIAGNSTSNTVTYSNAPSIGQIESDGTNNRVLVGYDKDGFGTGKDWGIKVSKSGYDVLTAADTNLVMSSAFNNLKVYATGTATLPHLVVAHAQAPPPLLITWDIAQLLLDQSPCLLG